MLYKSGDLGKLNQDGDLVFIGRADFQLKLNGQRLEAGEIERIILECPETKEIIDDCIVMKLGGTSDSSREEEYLVAACKWIPKMPITPASTKSVKRKIEEHISSRLQKYMIPKHIVFLPSFPLNNNGKLDRKTLTKNICQDPQLRLNDQGGADVLMPSTPLETIIYDVFVDALKLTSERKLNFGIHQSFFAFGGGSLTAMRMVGKLHQMQAAGKIPNIKAINFGLIQSNPTVAQFSKILNPSSVPNTADTTSSVSVSQEAITEPDVADFDW